MSGTGLIGGGRWARVIASVLARVAPGPVQVASPGNPGAWDMRPDGWRAVTMNAMLADPGVARVIIARRARDHAQTVLAALAAGKDVLVEKPFCLTRADGDAILATARGRVCQTGLVFLHAPNLRRFHAACRAAGPAARVRVHWADPAAEVRHGAAKGHDAALNPVQDVLPHVWSLVRPLVAGPLALTDATLAQDGNGVTLRLEGGARVDAVIARAAPRRARVLEVAGPGLTARLDFAAEPGVAVLNDAPLDVATGFSSPLEAELRAFLCGPADALGDVAQAVEALDLTLDAMARLRPLQAAAIRAGLAGPAPAAWVALREVALGGIAGDGRPAARPQVARWLGLDPADPALARAWTAVLPADITKPERRPAGRP
jgi:predicted dehydrogenase